LNTIENFRFSEVSESYYTANQLTKLQSIRIGIAGAGGLGSNCAMALVRSGFEKFAIIDFDIVSVSNLNRQQYYYNDIGKPKVECLLRQMKKVNPTIDCVIKQERIVSDNVGRLFDECDCIIEAFDSAECKAMIVTEFIHTNKLLISASGIGSYGNSDRVVTRKIHDSFYIIGDGVSEVGLNHKPYAPCVMIAAAKQADIVLDWVLNSEI
jgi:sulfur carrier protein ThiS adenylyltransferase